MNIKKNKKDNVVDVVKKWVKENCSKEGEVVDVHTSSNILILIRQPKFGYFVWKQSKRKSKKK